MRITTSLSLLLALFAKGQAQNVTPGPASLSERTDAPEPYPWLSSGGFTASATTASPDPLASYHWPRTSPSDGLQIYALKPVSATSDVPGAFSQLGSLTGSRPKVTVKGTGSIFMDFGRESAGWLEFDSPDLDGSIEMSISEYNEPAILNAGAEHRFKTLKPVRYGNTYRLELNKELYEGVRFGWIHVRTFNKPWHIAGIRLVCQTKPVNYTGAFSCSDPELTRIWYTGAYTVRLNLLKDYFGSILMERSDRQSWTGDAHPAQAAALAAFGNFDFIRQNLEFTSNQSNGIASYSLYWVLSLLDYYNYTGDVLALSHFLTNACGKLDNAYQHYSPSPSLGFYGWDERLGAGFENPDLPESRHAYAMLTLHVWHSFAMAMQELGRPDLAERYQGYADEKIAAMRTDPAWAKSFGLHAAADAINAGFTTPAEQSVLYSGDLSDRVNRLSYSPFNNFFIIQALARLNKTDDALGLIKDCWGGQLRYGATSFFEVYQPSWNAVLGQNGAPVNNQCGYTSLCHPWAAGVVKWLTEEALGIKPTTPGFRTYSVRPHLGRSLTWVAGQVQTPKGLISATVDVAIGHCSLTAPEKSVGEFCIPKAEREITTIRMGDKVVWDGKAATAKSVRVEKDYICLEGLPGGTYSLDVTYRGKTPAPPNPKWDYPVTAIRQDSRTQGNWGGVYGHNGHILCDYSSVGSNLQDRRQLPPYISKVTYSKNGDSTWQIGTRDPRALAPNSQNTFPRNAGAIYTQDPQACDQTMTVDIDLAQKKTFQVALYLVDWDDRGRRTAVELFDRTTLRRLAPVQVVRDYKGGKYLIYRCDRSVRFRIDQVRGDNATLSGIFFD